MANAIEENDPRKKRPRYGNCDVDHPANNSTIEEDNFKPVFKYFKRRVPPPDLARAEEFSENLEKVRLKRLDDPVTISALSKVQLRPDTSSWEVLSGPGGFLYVRNPFQDDADLVWAKRCLRDYARPPFRTNLEPESAQDWFDRASKDGRLASKLRWATLGYHHDWDTKVYSEDNVTSMPDDMRKLVTLLSQVLLPGFTFLPEASIVNFYPPGSSLGPHTDHSEPNLSAPLFSISFGAPAVFLLGGPSKAETPTPIMLRSGDVVVMAEEARRAYHAVPRILAENQNQSSSQLPEHGDEDSFVAWYLKHHRINLNVRQVN